MKSIMGHFALSIVLDVVLRIDHVCTLTLKIHTKKFFSEAPVNLKSNQEKIDNLKGSQHFFHNGHPHFKFHTNKTNKI